MELKEFIMESVNSIIEATRELSDQNSDALINPASERAPTGTDCVEVADKLVRVTSIEFDIAVSEASADKAGGGLKIQVLPIKVGADGEISNSMTSVSRLKFNYRVALPHGADESGSRIPPYTARNVI